VLPGPCYLFADAHLGVASREIERSAQRFVRSLQGRATSVIINGDLFDFWFEWRTVMPRTGFRVLSAIADLADDGVSVTWIAGNHDCWGGELLRREVGVTYHEGPWRGNVAGWRTRIEHGDGLRNAEDRRYRALRAVLRHPLSIRAFRLIHPDLGARIALGSSHASRTYRARDGGAGLRAVALRGLEQEPDLDLVVFGHSHVATLERGATGGVYANAGAWLDAPTYLRIDEDSIALMRYVDGGTDEVVTRLMHPRGAKGPAG
jgi:UDP-2,3-diacylglucosamine hydrolase